MNRQSQHLKLAPTAAMVMQMGGKIFQSHAISAEYLKYIDLSSADDYINQLKDFQHKRCDHVLTRGKNKGNPCNKKCVTGYYKCSNHLQINQDQPK